LTITLSDYESGAPFAGDYDRTLADLQDLISHQLVSLHVHRRRAIVVAEGWDAAGKGGAIQRLTAQCDPRHYHVWPIAAPSEGEKARHYLWRFWNRLPKAGEIAIFDRSWYGRLLVERVEGFATEAEWRRAYDEINEFESQQTADGTLIVKLFFHVTQEVQDKRPRRPPRRSLEALESHRGGFPQPRPPRRLPRRAGRHVPGDEYPLGFLDRHRRQ
jgi:polyphosphate kinase 2 (PPK2 family)